MSQTGCSICCPVCDHVCKLDAKKVDAEIPCFDVESKVICIPRVVFPWQKKKCRDCNACDGLGCTNCVHNGARVRRICVLKTDKITCPQCEYTWSTEKKCAGCDQGCDGCCDKGCDASVPETWQLPTMGFQFTESWGSGVAAVPSVKISPPNVVSD